MAIREGNLEAPKRHPIKWQEPDYYDTTKINQELERVFDICHGCRRCVSLCNAFPTLFDLVDESPTLEVDGVKKEDYQAVVDQCYLCDLCAETKCPYIPPHEWAVDFPQLMLRTKAGKFKDRTSSITKFWRDRLISSTGSLLKTLSTPGIAQAINSASKSSKLRAIGQKITGIHANAPLPRFHPKPADKQLEEHIGQDLPVKKGSKTTGKVAIYITCYGNHNEPAIVKSLVDILIHNGIPVQLLTDSNCCGMPKLELGDLDSVAKLKEKNIPVFRRAIANGYDIMSIIPSCTLMYREEIPLMFPEDREASDVANHFFDPFEYLMGRYKDGLVRTEFKNHLGNVSYHAACHQRVQNIGQKTREFLSLIPDTSVTMIERCSGHDGTYALKEESYEHAMKIARPVLRRIQESQPDTYGSDCPMAGRLIAHGMNDESNSESPLKMLARAYGLGN